MALDYFRSNVRYQPLDPVNLVFLGLTDLDTLLGAVQQVFDSDHWKRDPQDDEYLLEFDDCFRQQTDWRTRGPFWQRVHIRFWWGRSEIFASAHKERLRKWPFPRHDVESFDAAKHEIEHLFQTAGWQVGHDARRVGPSIQDPPANGWASEIQHP